MEFADFIFDDLLPAHHILDFICKQIRVSGQWLPFPFGLVGDGRGGFLDDIKFKAQTTLQSRITG
jgi:hypothetical protein